MTMSTDNLPDVDSLWFGCEDVQAREFDWSRGYGENWTSYQGVYVECESTIECEACDGGVVDQHVEGMPPIPCEECSGSGSIPCGFQGDVVPSCGGWECPRCGEQGETDQDEGPMMNYFYALPDHARIDPTTAAERIAHLPLCVIEFTKYGEDVDDSLPNYALALTGGGMDLSWQIAEAHMRLGYLPPATYCDLPNFAGMDTASPVNAWIIAGCRRTAEAHIARGRRMIERLDRLTAS